MKTQKPLEKTLRAFTLDKIRAISALVENNEPTIESSVIGNNLGTANQGLGGVISSLVRTKIDGEPLVKVIAQSSDKRQKLIRFNENVATKNEVKIAIKNIMDDFK